jgi:hypothetical protein
LTRTARRDAESARESITTAHRTRGCVEFLRPSRRFSSHPPFRARPARRAVGNGGQGLDEPRGRTGGNGGVEGVGDEPRGQPARPAGSKGVGDEPRGQPARPARSKGVGDEPRGLRRRPIRLAHCEADSARDRPRPRTVPGGGSSLLSPVERSRTTPSAHVIVPPRAPNPPSPPRRPAPHSLTRAVRPLDEPPRGPIARNVDPTTPPGPRAC